jgi:UDP-N-acetylglucosamine--N-acetylmuramyl-(pentapeptide) pyrophosphoryl-undecaprenol N-acetylglucosamine transferase
MSILFAGGGTGGHLYPALALADQVARVRPDWAIAFMGTPTRMEAQLVPQHGYRFYPVEVVGMPRRLGPELWRFGKTLLGSVSRAREIVREFRPRIVVGTGGYVSAPAVIAARLEGIPAVICEQNVFPGVANRVLSRLATRVFTTFPESDRYFPAGKAACVGNPIRPEAYRLSMAEARARLGFPPTARLLLVTGGSLGARSINRAVAEALESWLAPEDWSVLHVAGKGDFPAVSEQTAAWRESPRYRLVEFMSELPAAIAAADLVVSRAGATTLAELTAAGKPMVLVPFPYGGKDQPQNARSLSEAGAAIALPESQLGELAARVSALMADDAARARMGEASRGCGRPEAAERIVARLLELTESPA